MSKKCKTSKELAKAINNKEDVIVIEGDLKNKIIRIKQLERLHGVYVLLP